MKNWMIRGLATTMLTIATALSLVAPASATPRATLKAAAEAVAYERVGGGNYAKYKAMYPSELNWGNDGCSVPAAIRNAVPRMQWVLDHYMGVFQKSCDRHDFGYRNFGSNTTTSGVHPKFSPTEATKARIDTRFLNNMRVQCDERYDDVWDIPANKACRRAATIFYTAVNLGGTAPSSADALHTRPHGRPSRAAVFVSSGASRWPEAPNQR